MCFGRKLLITGKGRCNITSSLPMEDFISNIPGNGKFLYSSFQNFTNQDIIKQLKENGVEVKVERGNRVFPCSDRSKDVLDAFINELKKHKVKVMTNIKVDHILVDQTKVKGVLAKKDGREIEEEAEKVILATGGKSYPATGSTGDGYKMAQELGHTIKEIKPSLVPYQCEGKQLEECKEMQGLSLKNIRMKVMDLEKKKDIYEDFGELLFTHFGVSGPTILSSSAHLLRYKDSKRLLQEGKIVVRIDLKPALEEEKLHTRIIRDFMQEQNKQFKNSLDHLLPKKIIPIVMKRSKINPEKQVNSITKEEREKLVQVIKKFDIIISDFRPIEEAIITSGGIHIKEINPKTMESKIIDGLYFAGEIIDVDAYTGGFNLQIAYSTGYTAGLH
ncbi:MAG TPA: NAD(P)/FAD-dependent oxidoreductase [Candidatus Merdicola faecigallinarum]|uniref:NAD(P)/FAD-dependent oxidoreductase n=1 Tax=Candidatus Merdicola faecigallinarum TaxID=2840862 RepID=A0A9D1M111_9FIRM|nr:NAD(P)/FAD-dependent oxidoreductase [Candidatus Merdicola faecigallinarum]